MVFALQGARCLVTGATGLIGQAVSSRLLAEGAEVRAFVRNPSKGRRLAEAGADIVQGDITDAAAARRAVEGCSVVFHLAAALNDFRPISFYRRVNVDATRSLAEAALAAGIERLVYASTAWTYGFDAGQGTDEASPQKKSGLHYSDTKLEAESLLLGLARDSGLPVIVAQPSEVYGPNDPHWTTRLIELIRSGKMVLVNGGAGVIQPIFVDDVAEGFLAAARRGRTGERYILCGAEVVTIREYTGRLAAMVGKKHLHSMPGWVMRSLAVTSEAVATVTHTTPIVMRQDVRASSLHVTYSGEKARRELGFQPFTSLEEGMHKVEKWLAARSATGAAAL
jgi:nucleoside-diphosphate-sugar epimerase